MKNEKRFTKPLALILLCTVMMLAGAFAASAAGEEIGNSLGWERTADGWRYIKTNGYMAADEWMWIGEESTGYNCYFFDREGNLVVNAITVEGYRLNEHGQWEVDGVVQTRYYFDNTRPPFGNEVTNGYTIPTITLDSYMTSLIDVQNSASGFPNRKYILTMDNGDVLYYTTNNDAQIKIQVNLQQTKGQMVTAVEAPASTIFSNFPENGIEQSALYQNMSGIITSTVPIPVSSEELALYFDADPYSLSASGMYVLGDREYEVCVGLSQGTNGLYYIYPNSPVLLRLHVNVDIPG